MSDETAIETFFRTLSTGQLPTAVPVQSEDGQMIGLCSGGMEFAHAALAREIVLSDDPRTRAVAALYAIERTMEMAEGYGVKPVTHIE